jgi:Peptidoglycan-synthase activator LpoB
MLRRNFLICLSAASASSALSGCRGYQYGHIVKKDAPNLVGSHDAGAEVFDPLVEEAVAKLLGRQPSAVAPDLAIGEDGAPCKKSICFVGIENKSAEEIGDFKEQLYQQIDAKILESDCFQPISRRMVDAALVETRLRPDSLLIPSNMQLFTAVLQRQGAPFDYLLYAKLTSGTTERNSSKQRDYVLSLELTNVHTGVYDTQAAEIRKGYHKSSIGKLWHYNPMKS